jgi:hypothetical protein
MRVTSPSSSDIKLEDKREVISIPIYKDEPKDKFKAAIKRSRRKILSGV